MATNEIKTFNKIYYSLFTLKWKQDFEAYKTESNDIKIRIEKKHQLAGCHLYKISFDYKNESFDIYKDDPFTVTYWKLKKLYEYLERTLNTKHNEMLSYIERSL